MLLSELAARDVASGLREILNAAIVMEWRQVEMMRFQKEEWFKDEHRRHDLIRDQLCSIASQLESIQGRLKELREF